MAVPNIEEVATMSIESRARRLRDNVTNNNALLSRMQERGRIRTVSGGTSIREEHYFDENQSFQYYSGNETLNIGVNDVGTSADFSWKQAAVAVSLSGLDELINSGREQMIDLLSSRIEMAEITMQNRIAIGVYSDGTGSGGKQIGGIQLLVADDPTTGVVGGIDRQNWEYWRNVSFSGTTDGSGAPSVANIDSYMNAVYNSLVRGADVPDLIVADNNYYTLFEQALQAQQRFMRESDMARRGFVSLAYKNASVVLDGGIGGACPANHMYFLNTRFLSYRPHANRNMVPIRGDRLATNQDAFVRLIGWAGNMTTSGPKFQGVLIN